MAVILITHDMGVIACRTERVMVMYAGKIVEQASTPALFARMRHPYAQALLESIPRLDQDAKQRLRSIPGLPPNLAEPISGCRFAPRCRYAAADCKENEPVLTWYRRAPSGLLPSRQRAERGTARGSGGPGPARWRGAAGS